MDDQSIKRKQKGLRKDKRVQVTLTVGRKEDGSPDRKSFYGETRKEANAKREDYKLKKQLGLIVDKRVYVKDWIDTCLSLYRTKVDDAYKSNDAVPYHKIQKAIGRMYVDDVREADLQKLLNDNSNMSFSTVDKLYQAIRLVFDRARRNKLIFDNPAENLEMPDTEKGTHRALERWEIDCILNNWQQHRCGIWAMLLMLAGLRRGEMIGLDWSNVDMDNMQLTVKQVGVIKTNQSAIVDRAKTKAGIRTLPICQPLWDCLNSVPKDKRKGLVCTMADGKRITGSGFKRGWDGFNLAMQRILNGEPVIQQGRREKLDAKIEKAKAAGKQYVLFSVQAHDLRHTFATGLYDAGIDIKSAQYYLGHADIRMTLDLYTHLSEEREKAQRSQLVTFLDGWLKVGAENAENHEINADDHEVPEG
ncbi:MAG: site-specific integrase [Ruminococcus sp.]|nr:site-specific integrase [Ruminococcus sp.]